MCFSDYPGISALETPLFVFSLSSWHLAVEGMTSFNVSLKEGEILIYIDKGDIQLSVSFAGGFYFCAEQMNFFFKLIQGKHGVMLCGLKLASEKSCVLASGNEAANFEVLQFRS